MRKLIIHDVIKNSIADELGIQKGDLFLSINNKDITDIIDYKFEETGEFVQLEIEKSDGYRYLFEIEKDYDEDLGLVFKEEIIDKPKHCKNKCIFCFIDQLPKNVRESLKFKDDDYRLSFLQGNFITMTNMTDSEIERLIKYRMTPIYISVHATDDEIRKKMLNNPFASGILDKIKKLVDNGIEVHCQIVLCPGLNDGKVLDKTIADLSRLYPGIKSAAVVPVGLTDYRENLYRLEPYNLNSARAVVDQVSSWQKKLKSELGSSFIFIADEFYILSNKVIPEYSHYEDFPQIENGVGLIALFKYQFEKNLRLLHNKKINKNKYIVITGVSAFNFISEITERLRTIGFNIETEKIYNDFFGHNITVSGLIVGRDIINQMKGKLNGEILIIPDSMLKDKTVMFLDNTTLFDVEKELNTRIIVSKVDGKDFIRKIQSGR